MRRLSVLIVLAVSMAMMGGVARADAFRLEMGAGVWQTDPSGTIKYNQNPEFDVADTAGFDSENTPYAWIFVKHPIPIVPNVRLEYVDMEYSGYARASIVWNGVTYSATSYNELQMRQLDGVLYYNLLDNTFWLTLDLGLQVKYVDGSYKINDPTVPVNEDFSGVFPLLYGRLRAEIMKTGIGVEAIARGIAYNSSSIFDAEIKVDYTLNMIPVIHPGLEVGYRVQSVDLDHDDIDISADADVDFKGVFAGMTVRF